MGINHSISRERVVSFFLLPVSLLELGLCLHEALQKVAALAALGQLKAPPHPLAGLARVCLPGQTATPGT